MIVLVIVLATYFLKKKYSNKIILGIDSQPLPYDNAPLFSKYIFINDDLLMIWKCVIGVFTPIRAHIPLLAIFAGDSQEKYGSGRRNAAIHAIYFAPTDSASPTGQQKSGRASHSANSFPKALLAATT